MGNQYPFDITTYSSFVSIGDNGIYYADSSEKVSYPDDGNNNSLEFEENSFWFSHRNNCITQMINNYPPTKNGFIFDVGGGNGFVSKGLLDAGFDVVLVEPGLYGAMNAKNRGIKNVICATTHTAKFQSGTIHSIGVFDVVEHIEDDIGFLKHLYELLVPGGILYLTVPAYQFLWSQDDIHAGHFRRYSLAQIKEILLKSGFKISYSTYIFVFLPFFVFFFRTLRFYLKLNNNSCDDNTRHKKDHSYRLGIVGKLLNFFMNFELNRIESKNSIFLGGSCMLAVQKPHITL
jgi:SAM-dependent methyltransferase